MYGAELAQIYDVIYEGRGRDYAAECAMVAAEVSTVRPDAATLLDVAAGTGPHLVHLGDVYSRTEALELSPHMIDVFRRRLPDVPVTRGDMRDFALGRRFDVVTCFSSSIGYLRSTEELQSTLRGFVNHLTPGGVIAVEPWVFPEDFIPGYISSHLFEESGRAVARVSHSVNEGRAVTMTVHYIVAEEKTGARHFTDTHQLRLFTREEYELAFTRAGCTVEYRDRGVFGLGLFVATAR